MSFKHTLTLCTLGLSLSASIALAADLPGNVKNVQARVNGNEMTVLWSEVPGAVSYRVYYSHASILNSEGNYDDFEQTPNAQTTYVFAKAPLQSEKIYVGVLAVSQDGTESEGFETEAFVTTPTSSSSSSLSSYSSSVSSSVATTTSSSSSVSSEASMPGGENPTSTAMRMGIQSVEVVTETGILVSFTKALNPTAVINPGSFLITTVSGTVLVTKKTEVNGKQVLLTTSIQTPDTKYILGLLSAITADDGTNATPTEPQVYFTTPTNGQTSPPRQEYGRNPNLPSKPNPKPTDPTKLPGSGLGLFSIITVAGAEAGRRVWRKRQMV